jgi:hypothetical protein
MAPDYNNEVFAVDARKCDGSPEKCFHLRSAAAVTDEMSLTSRFHRDRGSACRFMRCHLPFQTENEFLLSPFKEHHPWNIVFPDE